MKNLSIFVKLSILLGVFALSLIAISTYSLYSLRENMIENRKQEVKTVIDAAVNMSQYYQGLADSGEMDQDTAIATYYRNMQELKFADGVGYLFAFGPDGVTQMHAGKPSLKGKNLWDLQDSDGNYVIRLLVGAAESDGYFSYLWQKPGKPDELTFEKISYAAGLPWGHIIGTGLYIDDIDEQFWAEATQNGVLSAVIILVVLGLSILISKDISGPLAKLQSAMDRISQGHYTDALPEADRRDEIGRIAATLLEFRAKLQQNEELRSSQQEMEKSAARQRAEETLALADQLEQQIKGLINKMGHSISGLNSTSSEMTSIAQQSSERSSEVRSVTSEASGNIDSVAAATEELTASAREIGNQIQLSSQVANEVSTEAEQTNTRVEALAQSIDRIGDVVKLIEDITEQTNLLALNATIEAARAGEAGKGFAVVANEVRSLAGQTANATTEITTQIKEVQSESQKALASVSGISGSITKVAEQANSIVSTVEEQNSAIQEIAQRVAQVSSSTHMVGSHIDDVASNAQQTLNATQGISSSADELVQESEQLAEEIDHFLRDIRSRANA
ncbi:methyl-accepting chemotaxis protein [Kiloniella sp. b19]|uniref:methyl-accepting chemotaxis protein n=1 Tax=Kiloniella sp. GXU_MW_B19 TaxID=3141326 RepID=UPI0031CFEF61